MFAPTASEEGTHSVGQPTGTRWRLVPDVALATVILAMFVLLTSGWFSADEVVMRQQATELVENRRWTAEANPVAGTLDPAHRFALLARSDRVEGQIAPYTKHPVAALGFATGRTLGDWGLYLPGLFSVLGSCVLLAWRFQWSRIAFWFPLLATTALFHLTVVWAHAPALFPATLVAVLVSDRDWPNPRRTGSLVAAVALVSLLRSEGLLLGAAVTGALLLGMSKADQTRRFVLASAPLLAAVAVYVLEPVVRSALFGSTSGVLNVPISGESSLVAGRFGVAQILFLEPSIGNALGQLRFVGALLLIGASIGLKTERLPKRQATLVAGVGALLYVVAVAGGPIPGLVIAMPLIFTALPWVRFGQEKRPLAAFGLFASAVLATSYDSAGGGDWGGRYLFIGVPMLLVAVIPVVHHLVVDVDVGPLLVAAAVAAGSIQVGVLLDILDRSGTVDVVDDVIASTRVIRAENAGVIVAVSDERLARFLYDRGLRGASFHVPEDEEDRFVEDVLAPNGGDVLWIDLPDRSERREGDVLISHGSVSMRTEVRR